MPRLTRMDSIGDSQWVVPIDPRPQATFSWERAAQPEGRGCGKGGVGGDSQKTIQSQRRPAAIPHRSRVDPEVAMENAQSKVARLQKALEAVGDMEGGCRRIVAGRVGEGPISSSVASNGRPDLKVQEIHREVRAASGLVGGRDFDRDALSEGRARLARLEDQSSRQPRAPPPQTEVRVEQFMEEISQLR